MRSSDSSCCLGVVVLPLVGGGIFFMRKGAQEEEQLAKINEQRRLLDIVSTRGQVSIADLVLELKSSRDEVEKNLNELVGRGLFSGYVDWNKGMLYSVEASKLQGAQFCPNCGGKLELAGKGVVTCPYCGVQISFPDRIIEGEVGMSWFRETDDKGRVEGRSVRELGEGQRHGCGRSNQGCRR